MDSTMSLSNHDGMVYEAGEGTREPIDLENGATSQIAVYEQE